MLIFETATLVAVCCVIHRVASYRVRTTTVREEMGNGRCASSESGAPICPIGWQNQVPISTARYFTQKDCQYHSMVRMSKCYSSNNTETRSLVCTRKRHYYDIKTNCYGQWLSWTSCSEECGSGVRSRYQFATPSQYISQSQTCNTHTCPQWSGWNAGGGCQTTCQQLFTRSCLYKDTVASPGSCINPNVSKDENAVHQWRPCLKCACAVPTTIPAKGAKSTTTDPSLGRPGVTKPKDDHGDTHPAHVPLYSNKTFWIGCCVGVAATILFFFLLFLIYFRTKSGRVTISVIKANSQKKTRSDRERRDSKNRKVQPVHADVINAPMHERRMPDPPLPSFSSMLKENNGGRSLDHGMYQSGGSLHNHSKYIESINPNLVEHVEYETFYTPVGESKRQSRKSSRQSRGGIFLETPKQIQQCMSSESFASDSESECYSERNRDKGDNGSNYQNDSAYYGGENSNQQAAEPFDEKSYLRQLEATRAGKKRRKSSKERRSRTRSDDRWRVNGDYQRHRRESGDSQSTIEYPRQMEVHYARPIKPAKRESRHSKNRPSSSDAHRVKDRNAATRYDEEAFEFPVPPNLEEMERSGNMSP